MNPLELLRCPCCAARLINGEPQLYETLVEHCTDPNGDFGRPGPRPTLVCSWAACPTRAAGTFWAHDGEGPFVSFFGCTGGIRWIDGIKTPIGSWWRDRDEADATARH